jgi:hypothetical protein
MDPCDTYCRERRISLPHEGKEGVTADGVGLNTKSARSAAKKAMDTLVVPGV